MDLTEMLRKLDEKFVNGEITEETYKEIKRRYEAETAEAHEGQHDSKKDKLPCGTPGGRERQPLIRVSGTNDYEGDVCAVKVDVSGCSDVGGDIDAEEVDISGSCDVVGSVKASKAFSASGSCEVDGNVDSPDVLISGACEIAGNVNGDIIDVSGAGEIGGNVTVIKCVLSGAVEIKGTLKAKELKFTGATDMNDVEAETVEGRGAFEFGRMKAKSVNLRLVSDAKADSIEADDIEIKLHREDGRLEVKTLVAKGRLDIDGVTADEVAGDVVAIGPHCRIGHVKGRKVEADPKASVGKVSKN